MWGPHLWPNIVCPSRSGGMMQPAKAAHGAFLARRKLAASGSSRAPCAFPNLRCDLRCWLFSCLGVYFHLRILPESTERSAAAIFGRSAPSYVLWCTSEYSVVGRISCHDSHDSIRTNVCQRSFADFFFANCKCKLDTRMNKNCSAEAGLGCLGASTAGAVKDAAGKAEPVP